jgi:hypothetical protein
MPVEAEDEWPETSDNGTRRTKLSIYQMVALVILVICQSMAIRVMSLPLNRLIESRYCLEYYRQHNPSKIMPDDKVPENLCKIDSVQKQLAVLQGLIETFHIFCGQ